MLLSSTPTDGTLLVLLATVPSRSVSDARCSPSWASFPAAMVHFSLPLVTLALGALVARAAPLDTADLVLDARSLLDAGDLALLAKRTEEGEHTVGPWQQCGGKWYDGPTKCALTLLAAHLMYSRS